MKYVLIGNSAAATACIEGIRSVDKSGEITVVSNENRAAYGRPLISYALLGKIKKENMDYRPQSFYKDNGVKLMLGETVTRLDTTKKRVILESGKNVVYDKLLVATGSRPFVPNIDGLDKVKNKFTFMTYADMEALEKELSPKKNVLVIGAGLIGLKCTEGILHRVKSVTVVDMAESILPSVLDKDGADTVQKYLESCGVKFILGDSVQKFEANKAILKSGKEIGFDILVMAVGVRPNVELVKDSGGAVNRGIVVDECMKTSLNDIYAAGDCAEGFNKSTGANGVLALLPNAAFQGRCAGINMAGGNCVFADGIPMNALGLFDCH
ncbi:MAG: NAD(P)/FAD-dependent oxidoreductase, partial [Clostridiales bacterium]|nr:NAD(P)/FAD-dependent oxidoreductase [Clostridiales bacterium]